jgi:hypothetical protein
MFQFSVDPDGFFSGNLEVVVPIVIGNVSIDPNYPEKPTLMFQVTRTFNTDSLFGNQGDFLFKKIILNFNFI